MRNKIPENAMTRRDAILAGSAALVGGALPAHAAEPRAREEGSGRLAGKVALVTGAARGIGRATALRLAREGADVALLDIADPTGGGIALRGYRLATEAELDEAVAAVRATGRRALKLRADVRDLAAMKAAADRAAGELGGLDVAVANAGHVVWGRHEDQTEKEWRDVVDVNLHGTMNTVWAALPHLRRRGGGRIITLSSIGGRQGVAGNGSYTPSKWAVIGLTKSLALELGEYGITVNAVAPTAVNTPMYRSEGQMRSTGMSTAAQQDAAMLGYHALPVPALEPDDVADGIAFLASDGARHISGLVLDIAAGGNARYSG